MERGCVEDQPQRMKSFKTRQIPGVLRLVEDNTAALRDFQNTLQRAALTMNLYETQILLTRLGLSLCALYGASGRMAWTR